MERSKWLKQTERTTHPTDGIVKAIHHDIHDLNSVVMQETGGWGHQGMADKIMSLEAEVERAVKAAYDLGVAAGKVALIESVADQSPETSAEDVVKNIGL